MAERESELELSRASRARIPAEALGALAGLRARPGVRVSPGSLENADHLRSAGACPPLPVEGARPVESLLVDWERGDRLVLERVLPIEGAQLFRYESGLWFPIGSRIPASPQPELHEPVPLARALVPAPLVPEPVPTTPLARTRLTLVRDARPRPTTAVRCSLRELAVWAEQATSHALGSVRAALSGEQVLLVGPKLPPLGERFWGQRVLRPLGFATDPDLPEEALARALGLGPLDLAIVTEGAISALPGDTLAPLSRAAVRVAARATGTPAGSPP